MGPALLMSVMLFQGGDAASSDHSQLLVTFVGIIAFCSFVQFLVFVGAAIAAFKAYKSVSAEIGALKQKAMPIIGSVQGIVADMRPKISAVSAKVQEIVEDATPKVKTITTNVADISDVAKNKVHDFEATINKANETVRAANDKTRAQVDKVDGMVSSTLKATSDLGNTIHHGIKTPVLEVVGVVNGLKAALDVLVGRSKGSPGGFPGDRATAKGAGRPSSPGPVRMPDAGPTGSSNPSSNVAPSPAAAEVVDQFHGEKVKNIY